MPISDEALQKEKNRFIAVKGEATISQALAALKALGGQPWWHAVVRMNDGSWSVARCGELLAEVEKNAAPADMQLCDFSQLKSTSAVDRATVETKTAQAMARKSPAHVLVVTENGLPIGILVEGVRRGAGGAISASLDQIGGKHVKLEDYGLILLGSSKK
jgi:hypothetical protein